MNQMLKALWYRFLTDQTPFANALRHITFGWLVFASMLLVVLLLGIVAGAAYAVILYYAGREKRDYEIKMGWPYAELWRRGWNFLQWNRADFLAVAVFFIFIAVAWHFI